MVLLDRWKFPLDVVAVGIKEMLSAPSYAQAEEMNFRKFFKIPVRLISRSSVREKIASLGTLSKKEKLNVEEKVQVPVESNPQRLVEYVCGSNIFIEGEDIKTKPDSEYPEWLWNIRSPPPLEELDPNSKTYWNRITKQRQKEEKYIRSLRRNATVHK